MLDGLDIGLRKGFRPGLQSGTHQGTLHGLSTGNMQRAYGLRIGLLRYFKLDHNSIDSIRGAKCTDTSMSYTMAAGNWGRSAALFNGTNSKANPNDSEFGFAETAPQGAFSIWIKPDSSKATVQRVFALGGGFGFLELNSNGNGTTTTLGDMWFTLFTGPGTTLRKAGGSSLFTPDAWNHICGSWSNSGFGGSTTNGSMKLYVNGAQVATSIMGVPNAQAVHSYGWFWCIGTPPTDFANYKGSMMDFAMWTRELLPEEVLTLYNNGKPFPYLLKR